MANKSTYKTKINRLSGVLATLLAIVVAATILLCVGFGVYGSDVSKWFKPQNNVEQNNISDPTVINTVTEHGIALTSGEAMVASDGTLSKKLTATVTPASSAAVGFKWSVAFVNPNSTWAQGKTVTDYVTVTKDADNDLKATVTFIKHFSEQIKVTVACRLQESIYATATVDCYKDVLGVDINFVGDNSFTVHVSKDAQVDQPSGYLTGYYYTFTITPTYGDGTLNGTFALELVDKSGNKWTDGGQFQLGDVVEHGEIVTGGTYPMYIMFNGERWAHQSEAIPMMYYETPTSVSLDNNQITF